MKALTIKPLKATEKKMKKKCPIGRQFIKEQGLSRTRFSDASVQLVGLEVSVTAMKDTAVLNLSCPDILPSVARGDSLRAVFRLRFYAPQCFGSHDYFRRQLEREERDLKVG
ncbi:hypothetical protein CDAR_556781 [Caerostris darwini]|uniref:PilZ domain-containing protein n=1 Tax=Caerostris darwini TaxID=1538125 RepID=A0AAV4RC00_9ARAC|nr:hypothetical protein CDAR_556781 [Caerostris darwini]